MKIFQEHVEDEENFKSFPAMVVLRYLTMCQDGIHVGGGSHNGVIKNVFAKKGNPNDDLIAFNADDTNTYCQNFNEGNGY